MRFAYILIILAISIFSSDIDTFYTFDSGFFPRHIVSDGIAGAFVVSGNRSELVHIQEDEIDLRVSISNEFEISDMIRSGLDIILAAENSSQLLYYSKNLIRSGIESLEYNNDDIIPSSIFASESRRIFIIDEWNKRIYLKDEQRILEIERLFPFAFGRFYGADGIALFYEDDKRLASVVFAAQRSDSTIKMPKSFDSEKFVISKANFFNIQDETLYIADQISLEIDSLKFEEAILDISLGFDYLYLLTEKHILRLAN